MKNDLKYFLFILLLPFATLHAQAYRLDSLLTVLAELPPAKTDKEMDAKAILCNNIAVDYQSIKQDNQARSYFLQSLYFAEERIKLYGKWDAQAYYDMAYLYSNLATFESTTSNIQQASKYLNMAERYLIKLGSLIEEEDEYLAIMANFYSTSFSMHYHASNYGVAEECIDKALRLSTNGSDERLCNFLRLKGELYQRTDRFEQAIKIHEDIFERLNLEENKGIAQELFVHSIISTFYHSENYQAILNFMEKTAPYNSLETIDSFFANNTVKNKSKVLNNLFIYAYANMKVFKTSKNVDLILTAFKIQKLAFRLAEEFTLESNAEKLGSSISNPKNKTFGIILNYLELSKFDRVSGKDVLEILRILDVVQSTRLHLERVSYGINAGLWEQEKLLKNELIFTNTKLDEATRLGYSKKIVDSLRNTSFKQSIALQNLSKETKRSQVLDEYKFGHSKYFDAVQHFVKEKDKTILTYFYEHERDSVFILGVSPDTIFLTTSIVSADFSQKIKELYSLNANLQFEHGAIERQKELNQELYRYLLAPVRDICTKDLLIFPLYEMSYISFDALMNDQGRYAVYDYTFQYTTSLFSVVSKAKKAAKKSDFVIFKPADFGTDTLALLTHATDEVMRISELIPTKNYIDSAATITNLEKNTGNRGVIHVASHSVINFEKPYESYVVFDANETKNQLFAYEIFSKTFNADLVTLSSCNSGNGEIEEGIGIVSLSNAFYFAGVPSTVSSLWSAQDKSSSALMIDFYKGIAKGQTKSESLQQSKITYLDAADKIRQQPFFWANYVLYGSDDSINISTVKNNFWSLLITGSAFAILFGMLFYFKSAKRRKASL